MSKGDETKNDILEAAFRLAASNGLEGLTIGGLAREVGMSKSGLFAHFQSKETLQCDLLQWTRERYTAEVFAPALKAPRGVPRLREFFRRSQDWQESLPEGGCIFIAAASEFDDQPGAVKDLLQSMQWEMLGSLARMAQGAISEGQFRQSADPEQFAFDCYSLLLGFHHFHRLLHDKKALKKLNRAIEDLFDRYDAKESTHD